jgi:hypothetical protein
VFKCRASRFFCGIEVSARDAQRRWATGLKVGSPSRGCGLSQVASEGRTDPGRFTLFAQLLGGFRLENTGNTFGFTFITQF